MSSLLQSEQEDLLIAMVEAARSLPRHERQTFLLSRTNRDDSLYHPGFPKRSQAMFIGDFVALERAGLVQHINRAAYDVAPRGYAYYEEIQRRSGQPMEHVLTDTRRYLDTAQFESRHPGSSAKWRQAESLLWGDDVPSQLTAIGHYCREAVQLFATELVDEYAPSHVDPDLQHEIRRVEAVLKQRAKGLGATEEEFLIALFQYWRALSALVQRQEHGAARDRDKAELLWEDARRLVYQTANVMYEIDRSLARP